MKVLSPATVIAQNKNRFFFLLAGLVLFGNILAIKNIQWFGTANIPEWPVAFDLLIMLPVLYLLMHGPKNRNSWIGAAAIGSLGIFAGTWLLPEESKQLWLWLEPLRYLVISIAVFMQLILLAQIIRDAKQNSAIMHFEDKLACAVERRLGGGFISKAIRFESRIWLYAFGRKVLKHKFDGEQHFSTHQQNSNASNQQGFLIIIAAEIPLMHFVIHLFSPITALVITVLSLYSLIFLLAEYRATIYRPISLSKEILRIRYGVIDDFIINLSDIIAAEHYSGSARRQLGRVRCIGAGAANVKLLLKPDTALDIFMGKKVTREILIGLDDALGFLNAINKCKNESSL